MSEKKRYIVEANDDVQMISLIAVRDGTAVMITGSVDKFQTADTALEEAYQKGYDEAKRIYQNPHAESDYQRGLNDAWEAARKIVVEPENGGYAYGQLEEGFGIRSSLKILCNMTPSEAISKIKTYEEKKKAESEIKVGDEVRNTLGLMDNAVGYVIGTTIDGDYNVSRYIDGKIKTGTWRRENCAKTGKHSETVVQLLAEMEGGAE